MKAPRQLVLVRHAETIFNAVRPNTRFIQSEEARERLMGMADHRMDLTPEGEQSLITLGSYVRKNLGIFDVAFHSGFLRTRKTLEGILQAYTPEERSQIVIRKSQLLRERDSGYTYNMTEEEANVSFPWLREYWKLNGPFFARPVGGESIATVADRLEAFFRYIGEDYPRKKVLLAVHGRVKAAARFVLEDWDYEEAERFISGPSPLNCGITTYEYSEQEGRLVLKQYNECPR